MDTRQSRTERREAERKARKAEYKAQQAEHRNPSPAVASANAPAAARTINPRPSQTGPRTPAGKSASSMNAFRHGLTSAKLVLPWENEDEFNELLEQLIDEHQPVTATEAVLVREMAEQYWRLQRVRNQEYGILLRSTDSDDERKGLALLDRYATRHERSFHKCLNTLRKLQKERRAKPAEDFVSQNAPEPAPQRPSESDFEVVTRENLSAYIESLALPTGNETQVTPDDVRTTETAA